MSARRRARVFLFFVVGLDRGEDGLHGDASAGDQLPAGVADGGAERGCPGVLPHQQRRSAAGLDSGGDRLHVFQAEEVREHRLVRTETALIRTHRFRVISASGANRRGRRRDGEDT
jgi:hypothetical protein